jgi:hypothetical protein
MTKARITRTSADSAICEPIVLRDGESTRLVFSPVIVNNQRDRLRPVKGDLLWQRRTKGGEWQDEASLKLTTMQAGSGVRLALSTDELHLMTLAVRGLYGFFWKNSLPKSGDEIELADWAKAAKEIGDPMDMIGKIVEESGVDSLSAILKWAVRSSDAKAVIEHLARLDPKSLNEINAIAGIGSLKRILDVWEANRGNHDEKFWQRTLQEYPFVLSQVFAAPVVVLQGKAYVGGKSLEGIGGKEPDYILKKVITGHALLVEIKTPATQLMLESPYRPPDVYTVSREVSGAVTQIAKYKDEFLKNFHAMHYKAGEKFGLVEPQCLIVIGHSDQLDSDYKNDSFELFRRNLRHTDILTFDELFHKITTLVGLLEGDKG